MNPKKYDFSWGNPYFLLEALSSIYGPNQKNMIAIESLSYGPDEGMADMVEATKQVIKQTTGQAYDTVLITNGATHAINILLAHYSSIGLKIVRTLEYGYPFYDDMIEHAGLMRKTQTSTDFAWPNEYREFRLIDSPSNPMGKITTVGSPFLDIWDAAYHNSIYTDRLRAIPDHKIMVGSFSKLLGVSGARIGWIAYNKVDVTQSSQDAILNRLVKSCATVSKPSQELVMDILSKISLDNLMAEGKRNLNQNKGQFQKIEYLFDGQEVGGVGMFYCVDADKKALEILDKASVNYVRLEKEKIRLSMGQTRTITKDGIANILKTDGK